MRSSVVVVVLALLAGGGCAPEGTRTRTAPAGPLPVDRIFPLEPNSRWSYRIQNFARHLTYRSEVSVRGREYVEAIGREGIAVEERFIGDTGPGLVDEPEPMLYVRREGFLERVYLTYQGGKAVPIGFGSEESRFLPEVLEAGLRWESNTVAFRVGSNFGYAVVHHHVVAAEPELVRVPAGDFASCIRVDTSSDHGPGSGGRGEEMIFYYADWYAPGVGLVRTEQWGDPEKQRLRTRIELLEYRIGP